MDPAEARAQMVAAIAADGSARDPAVLGAIARVPREAFVSRFWAVAGPGAVPRAFHAGGDRPDPTALRLVYDKDRALAIRWDPGAPGGTTSTASAPGLMATMLELLDLRPGHRVLEIGTGSGYNAALLVQLVGDPSLVTSIDIDPLLVARAAGQLTAHGCGGVQLLVGDGAAGAPGRRFDRVVATVGCVDLAPAWLSQLELGGLVLLPLVHGAGHPLVRVRPGPAGAADADVVGRSGFVAIRGRQAGRSPWVHPGPPPAGDHRAKLPPEVARALAAGDRAGEWWNLGFFLAVSDRRAGLAVGLADGVGSGSWIPPGGDRVLWDGPAGPALRDAVVAGAVEWSRLGRPQPSDFGCRFVPPAGPGRVGRVGAVRWVVDRLDYRQVLELTPVSG